MKNHKVVLDDTVSFKVFRTKNKFANIVLETGEHEISIDGKSKQKFSVGGKGGILNVSQKTFVIAPLKYSTKDIWSTAVVQANVPIIIDSLVVFEKELAKDQKGVLSLLNNSMAKDILTKNLIKIKSNQLFIDKTWDYGINETPPEQISVEAQKSSSVTRFKQKIFDNKSFLTYATLSGYYYIQPIEESTLENAIDKFNNQ